MLTNTPPDPEDRLRQGETTELAFRAFLRTFGLLNSAMEPYFNSFGITGAQWGVLRALRRAEDSGLKRLRMTDLGKRLLIRPPSVTGVISRLERLGYVERRPNPTDQRAKDVGLTSDGRKVLNRVLQHHPRQMDAVLGGLTQADRRELNRLMLQMASHLEALQRHGQKDNGTRS